MSKKIPFRRWKIEFTIMHVLHKKLVPGYQLYWEVTNSPDTVWRELIQCRLNNVWVERRRQGWPSQPIFWRIQLNMWSNGPSGKSAVQKLTQKQELFVHNSQLPIQKLKATSCHYQKRKNKKLKATQREKNKEKKLNLSHNIERSNKMFPILHTWCKSIH